MNTLRSSHAQCRLGRRRRNEMNSDQIRPRSGQHAIAPRYAATVPATGRPSRFVSAEVQNSFFSQCHPEYRPLDDKVKAFSDKHIAPTRRYLPEGRTLRDMFRLSELADNRGYFQYRRQLLESSSGAVVWSLSGRSRQYDPCKDGVWLRRLFGIPMVAL